MSTDRTVSITTLVSAVIFTIWVIFVTTMALITHLWPSIAFDIFMKNNKSKFHIIYPNKTRFVSTQRPLG